MKSRLSRFQRLTGKEWLWLMEAALAICMSSVAIRLMPFRQLAKVLKWMTRDGPAQPAHGELLVAKAGWAIEAVSRAAPWRTVCFQKGLALQWMMRRRNVKTVLNYGVARQAEKGLMAHVWISFQGLDVMGGEVADQFARVASFPSNSSDCLPQTGIRFAASL
jgi:hypothetical protein